MGEEAHAVVRPRERGIRDLGGAVGGAPQDAVELRGIGEKFESFAVVKASQLVRMSMMLSHARLLLAAAHDVPAPAGLTDTMMLLADAKKMVDDIVKALGSGH